MTKVQAAEDVPAGHYRCDHCQGVFEKGRSDEEALAEAAETFPDMAEDDRAVVCDECYKDFMRWFAREGGNVH